jgi:trans-aconitate methyltransferase
MAAHYDEWSRAIPDDPRQRYVASVLALLDEGVATNILELGCVGGSASSEALAARGRLTGVDISPVQIERARRRLPDCAFVCADFSAVELPAPSTMRLSRCTR